MVAYEEGKGEDGDVNLRLLLRGLLMERKAALVEADAVVDVVNDLDVHAPAALKSVLKELLNNACRFRSTERPLRIVMASRMLPEEIEVAVSDNGIGVDPAYLENIFAPFFRCIHATRFAATVSGSLPAAGLRKAGVAASRLKGNRSRDSTIVVRIPLSACSSDSLRKNLSES